MSVEIKVPVLPESVSDASVAVWHKQPGESIARDEVLVELETDKVMLEIPAPADGVLESIAHDVGAVVTSDTVLGVLSDGASAAAADSEPKAEPATAQATEQAPSTQDATSADALSPSVRQLIHEHDLNAEQIKGTGKGGRITKQDVLAVIKSGGTSAAPAPKQEAAPEKDKPAAPKPAATAPAETASTVASGRSDERVKMTRLRQRVAERLVSVGQETAMLTTFNEVDMLEVMNLRQEFKDKFEKTHGVRLGFMSFFIKAAVEALKQFPAINASIDGDEIVYHNYFDVGIAVGGGKGLVVPILRDVETMGMADIEKQVRAYGAKAKENKITLEEMTGGTFTITNGGVYGSMLSTPIINPPQSAILGMHNIVERPVVVNGEIVVRPIMYLALSYDHRIVDGKEAVSFLVAIKQFIEEPTRMLLAV